MRRHFQQYRENILLKEGISGFTLSALMVKPFSSSCSLYFTLSNFLSFITDYSSYVSNKPCAAGMSTVYYIVQDVTVQNHLLSI
jgi:hypothetical protein